MRRGGRQLPPRYVNVPVALLYDVDLSPAVCRTALRIYGLGWRRGYRRTDPVGLDELLEICEVGRSTLYRHLATLAAKRVLRYTTVNVSRVRTFVFELLIGARTGPAPPRGMTPKGQPRGRPNSGTDSTIVVDVVPSSPVRYKTPLDRQQQHNDAVVVAVGGECERGGGASGILDTGASKILDAGASEILDALGIVEPTRSELLRLAHVTESYLEGWLAWYASQDGLGPGWVVTQIRQGAAAPASRREQEAAERRRYLAWGGRGDGK